MQSVLEEQNLQLQAHLAPLEKVLFWVFLVQQEPDFQRQTGHVAFAKGKQWLISLRRSGIQPLHPEYIQSCSSVHIHGTYTRLLTAVNFQASLGEASSESPYPKP